MKHNVICPNCQQTMSAVLRKDAGQPFVKYKTMLVCMHCGHEVDPADTELCEHPECGKRGAGYSYDRSAGGRRPDRVLCDKHAPLEGFCPVCSAYLAGDEYEERSLRVYGLCSSCEEFFADQDATDIRYDEDGMIIDEDECETPGCVRPAKGYPYPGGPHWFCGQHAIEAGYCPSCRAYVGVVDSEESFLNDHGLCEECCEFEDEEDLLFDESEVE